MNPTTAILGIGTALPAYTVAQADIADLMADSLKDRPDLARFARRIFKSCGVETRYTVEPSYLGSIETCCYLPSREQSDIPTTEERMKTYQREALPLAIEAAKKAISEANRTSEQITHLITVSCTGQFLPGLDVLLIRELQLNPRVNRLPLIFQGCSAGLKAIQMARDVVPNAPDAHVLVVCVELCTLHFQPVKEREALFAASFFGDGASACVIGEPGKENRNYLELGTGYAVLLPDCTGDMTWEVGNHGFDLYLSPRIPKLLAAYLEEELQFLLKGNFPELWAIHPGGKGIVDSVQNVMNLTDQQTHYSREILRTVGNLSSNTILFVLNAMQRDMELREKSSTEGVALAFGPGLTAELMRFTYVPTYSRSTQEQSHHALF
ncbi:type III polyketide synthase [Pullulanibacillus sp. KACC 23026]|uniref:type III polyketide synthase n=1 Tax=Pullulanibacillus sp. KACC 23026 TaxID=3028315 RepID=UPI0023AF03BF|nr:type III polyketide synthase [Pullulanibacillus sp. KACC 23026]WEG14848.1 type III polyketide synthase [Pullulanibacillus sp. KACC 23026]